MTLEEYELYELTKPSFIQNVNFSTEAKHRDPVEPLVQGRNGISHEEDTPVEETRVVCVYNVTTTEEPTLLLLGEDFSCFRPDVDIYEIFSGMEIDGIEQKLDQYYQFNTTGEHVIKYTLNDDVTNFEAVFFNVDNLISVIIPNNITIIDESAFVSCDNLSSITIPHSVTSIGNSAFSSCDSLEKVIVKDIAAWCSISFNGSDSNPLSFAQHLYSDENTEIKDLVIPNSVTTIGGPAFQGCTGLTSVNISNSVTSIGDYAFYNCSGLTSIIVESGNNVYDSRNNCNAIIRTANNELIIGCKNTVIPNSVTSIGGSAFYGCTGLTSITIPNSVTSIEGSAFYDCSGLTSVTIPNSVTSIEGSAFYDCSGLTSVTIGNSVISIGNSAFSNCTSLTSITIPNSVTSIESDAFRKCTGLISVTIGNSITSIEDYVFEYCNSLTSVIINNSVPPTLGRFVFYENASSRKIYVPAESVNTYKSATGWSSYANDIEAIS